MEEHEGRSSVWTFKILHERRRQLIDGGQWLCQSWRLLDHDNLLHVHPKNEADQGSLESMQK